MLIIKRRLWHVLSVGVAQIVCAGFGVDSFQAIHVDRFSDSARCAYSVNDDKSLADYRERIEEDGVSLGQQDDSGVRHLVLLLDGIPFDLMEEAYGRGMFRNFHPPSRLYSVFPSMTWVAFPQIFHCAIPAGIEQEYVDRATGRLVNGRRAYLKHLDVPWREYTDYRAGFAVETLCYLAPGWTLSHEIGEIRKRFERSEKRVMFFYVSSTAGMGTKHAREGFAKALKAIDGLCDEILLKCRGKATITILSDHGHSLTAARRINLKAFLKSRGYKIRKEVRAERDIAIPTFGLISYAAINARDPKRLAQDLVELEGTDLVIYRSGDHVEVVGRGGSARIYCEDGAFRYAKDDGDPLELGPILDELASRQMARGEGFVADRDIFEATALHKYPDPLYRIWFCWNGMVANPPDLIVTFEDRYFWGSAFLDFWAEVSSTHGSLNYGSTAGIAMSTAAPLPPFIRDGEVKQILENYFPFPGAGQ